MSERATPPRWLVVAAFGTIYLVWGSTYLAIAYALETIPPFLLAGVRFLLAGAILYSTSRLTGAPRPSRAHWKATGILGTLFFLFGNGSVVWAEQRMSSGLTAVVVAMVTAWTVLAEWGRPGGKRPSSGMFAGILVGFAGVALLLLPGTLSGQARVSTLAIAVLMPASFLWAVGSIYSRHAELPRRTIMVAGMEMLCGGLMLAVAGIVSGEAAAFHPSAISLRSVAALAYLVVCGSLLAFTAFAWLLQVSTPAKVSTYGYVNPMVAVILGWLFRGEHLSPREVFASMVIVGAVVVIVTSRSMTSGIRGFMRSGRRTQVEGILEPAKAGVSTSGSPERAPE